MTRRLSVSPEAATTMRHVLHEVRTPLAQIIGYSEMLQEEVRERDQEDLLPDLEEIRSAAQQLLAFLEEVFQPDAGGEPAPAVAEAAPLAAAPTPTPAVETGPGAAEGSLLVVDDEERNRDLLARRLARVGYRVATAADGDAALRAIDTGEFDLVLLDVIMPGTSGLQVLEALRRTWPPSELPVIMATALGASEDTVRALEGGANDYVTKPFDLPVLLARVATQLSLRRAAREIAALAQQLEIRNSFIRRTFGRYISDEIVSTLLDDPAGLELRGERRRVTIMMSDLRGFSALTEALTPTQVVSLLNVYLGRMAEVIQSHGGTIDEFQGDGILAFFGAPVAHGDDAVRALRAAVEMQLAIAGVNEHNRRAGLPDVEMGIGIATGEAIVGNIGSESRTKYGAVGSTVNLAARIESYSVGGDVLVDDATRHEAGELLRVSETRRVHPKGFEAPLPIHRVASIGGREELSLPEAKAALLELAAEIPIRFAVVAGKDVDVRHREGAFSALSASGARLRCAEALPELSNLRIEILDERGRPLPGAFYAKVVAGESGLVHFTTRSPALEQVLRAAAG